MPRRPAPPPPPPPEWSGEPLVSRQAVARALNCHPVTVSRRLSAYCRQVGGLQRYDLAAILRDYQIGAEP